MEVAKGLDPLFPTYIFSLCVLVIVGRILVKNENTLSQVYMVFSHIISAVFMIHMFQTNKLTWLSEMPTTKDPKTGEIVPMKFSDVFPPMPEITMLGTIVMFMIFVPFLFSMVRMLVAKI